MQGKTNNPNGRPKGSPNKTTTDLRKWVTSFIEDQREQLIVDFKALEPKDRVMMFERLLKYSLPTLQATSLTTDFDKLSEEDIDRIINELKQISNDSDDNEGEEN